MGKRTERPKSIVPFYMYRGQQVASATSRFSVRAVVIWAAALVLIGLVSWLYLLQASQVSTYAFEIRTLQLTKERLNRQNTALRGQVAMAGSLNRIHAVAEEWGYDLPDAADRMRRATLVYEPMPTPGPATETVTGLAGAMEDVNATGRRLFERLAQEMQDWLVSAQPASAE